MNRLRTIVLVLSSAAIAAGCGGSEGSGNGPDPVPFNLSAVENGVGGILISGVDGDLSVGGSVSGGGDVNGDGLDDVIVSSGNEPGQAFVVFGKADTSPVLTTDLNGGPGGFTIVSDGADAILYKVAMVGDVNGDGLDDVAASASFADVSGVDWAGIVFVIFGKATTSTVDVADIANGIGGFANYGTIERAGIGQDIDGAGDVNGDGLDDIIVGATGIGPEPDACYVVFGKATTAGVSDDDLAAGLGGFAVLDTAAALGIGMSVSGAGDVNSDGFDDVILGAPRYDAGQPGNAFGAALVVFGKATTTVVDVDAILAGIGGYAILGGVVMEVAGIMVSEGDDVNGDGFDDVLVGSIFYEPAGSTSLIFPGAAHVVFGKTSTEPVLLEDVRDGIGGIYIHGSTGEDSMYKVGAAGDVNGDGLDDVIVGAPGFWLDDGFRGGATYVIFGLPGPGSIDVRDVAARQGGYVFAAEESVEHAGGSVSTAGDVNGDGINDLLIGAHGGSNLNGRAYVVFLPPADMP